MKARALFFVAVLAGCGGGVQSSVPTTPSPADQPRQLAHDFAVHERGVLELMAASDPRLAQRLGLTAGENVLRKIGTDAVLAEDGKTAIQGSSLDLFSFKARARTLASASVELAKWKTPLPDTAPAGSELLRPRLERELLARLVEEERSRVAEEEALGDASAALVRAMVATWVPGGTAFEWRDRDEWAARRLLEIRASLKSAPARIAASDLDSSLYELERVLVPMQFPRAVGALTELHNALDADDRPEPAAMAPERLAWLVKTHLGAPVPVQSLALELETTRAAVAKEMQAAVAAAGPAAKEQIEHDARAMLFEDARCPEVPGAPVRSARAPEERSAICAVLRQAERTGAAGVARAAALVALHDELVVALWTVAPPAPRAQIATVSVRVDEDLADKLKHLAAARPAIPLGAGLAARVLFANPASVQRLAAAWLAFGDAPLDVVERELGK